MSFEFGGVQGYLVGPDKFSEALAAADAPFGSMFFSRFYPESLWNEALGEVRAKGAAGGLLSELGAAALMDVVCRAGRDAGFIKVPIEVGHEFGGFARRWYPRLLGSVELGEQALAGGVLGLRGSGRFAFGSLSPADVEALGEREIAAEDRQKLASDGDWADLWAEAFVDMVKAARGANAWLVFLPHYIELLGDENTYEGAARPPEEQPPDVPPGPNILETLQQALQKRASDIHAATGAPLLMKVKGRLESVDPAPFSTEQVRHWIAPVMTDAQIAGLEKEGIVFSFGVKDLGRFRVAMSMQRAALTVSIRVLPLEAPTLKAAGLKPSAAALTPGLTIVAGAAGSGRTTAVASILRHLIDTRACRILTIDEPIEYVLKNGKGVGVQIEIGSDLPTFARAVLQARHGDFDVVAIDHVDDRERAEAAILLSAGRRVVSTAAGSASSVRKRFPGATVLQT